MIDLDTFLFGEKPRKTSKPWSAPLEAMRRDVTLHIDSAVLRNTGRITTAQQRVVDRHVRRCPHCRCVLNSLRTLRSAGKGNMNP
jgi:hypothetical protein